MQLQIKECLPIAKISIWLPRLSTVLALKMTKMRKRNFILGFPKHLSRRVSNVKYRNSTELSKYIWHFKNLNITPKILWEIAAVIRCATKIDCCKLCLTEKLYIVSFGNSQLVKSGLVNACRHKKQVIVKKFEKKS